MTDDQAMEPDALNELTRRIAALDGKQALAAVDAALRASPQSAQLYFLRGSLLAEDGAYVGALADFRVATELAPKFAIARFQLGLLQLCLGEADEAKQVWARLDELDESDCLRMFKVGLCLITEDRLQEGIEWLKSGQLANESFPPLNRDMQLLIERAQARLEGARDSAADDGLHVLLAGYAGGSTKH